MRTSCFGGFGPLVIRTVLLTTRQGALVTLFARFTTDHEQSIEQLNASAHSYVSTEAASRREWLTADAVMRTPGNALPLFPSSAVSRQPAVSQKFASAPIRVLSAPETREYSPGPARVPAVEEVVRARRVRQGNRPGRRLRPPQRILQSGVVDESPCGAV
jgi:hypothetical protein